VKSVIIEEMVVDALTEDHDRAYENIVGLADPEKKKRLLETAIKKIASRERPSQEDFSDFWKGLK
jgi:hypothetical protein